VYDCFVRCYYYTFHFFVFIVVVILYFSPYIPVFTILITCSRERLPAAAAQPVQGSSEPVAPRIYLFILFVSSSSVFTVHTYTYTAVDIHPFLLVSYVCVLTIGKQFYNEEPQRDTEVSFKIQF
jgi:O-antigen ligase